MSAPNHGYTVAPMARRDKPKPAILLADVTRAERGLAMGKDDRPAAPRLPGSDVSYPCGAW